MPTYSRITILCYKNKDDQDVKIIKENNSTGLEKTVILVDNIRYEEKYQDGKLIKMKATFLKKNYGFMNIYGSKHQIIDVKNLSATLPLEKSIKQLELIKSHESLFDARINASKIQTPKDLTKLSAYGKTISFSVETIMSSEQKYREYSATYELKAIPDLHEKKAPSRYKIATQQEDFIVDKDYVSKTKNFRTKKLSTQIFIDDNEYNFEASTSEAEYPETTHQFMQKAKKLESALKQLKSLANGEEPFDCYSLKHINSNKGQPGDN